MSAYAPGVVEGILHIESYCKVANPKIFVDYPQFPITIYLKMIGTAKMKIVPYS